MCCYLGQNPKLKGNISPSNFDRKVPNILYAFLSVRALRVVAVT